MLIIVVLIMAGMISVTVGDFLEIRNKLKISKNLVNSYQAVCSAEAGVEDALLRLKSAMSYSSPYNLQVGSGSTTISISDALGGSRSVVALGGNEDLERKISVTYELVPTSDASFHYGAQAGDGGFLIQNSSKVIGNLYSNGNVQMDNKSSVTETVKVAKNGNRLIGGNVGGDVYVDICENAKITGVLHGNTNTGCTPASFITPLSTEIATASLPITDAQIAQWKSDAEAGGVHTGNLVLDDNTHNYGPIKIVGNLTVRNDAIINMMGTIWVTGNVSMENSSRIKLDASYGQTSGILVSDGTMRLRNTAKAIGSGAAGSYLTLISTSASNPAINVEQSFQADILFTNRGEILIQNSTFLREVTGYRIHLENGAEIRYESGLADVSFTGGPGGSWNITSWQEIE